MASISKVYHLVYYGIIILIIATFLITTSSPAIAQNLGDKTEKICSTKNSKIVSSREPPWDVTCYSTLHCTWQEYVRIRGYKCPEEYEKELTYSYSAGRYYVKSAKCIYKGNLFKKDIIPAEYYSILRLENRSSSSLIQTDNMCGDLTNIKNGYKPKVQTPTPNKTLGPICNTSLENIRATKWNSENLNIKLENIIKNKFFINKNKSINWKKEPAKVCQTLTIFEREFNDCIIAGLMKIMHWPILIKLTMWTFRKI